MTWCHGNFVLIDVLILCGYNFGASVTFLVFNGATLLRLRDLIIP